MKTKELLLKTESGKDVALDVTLYSNGSFHYHVVENLTGAELDYFWIDAQIKKYISEGCFNY